MSLLPFPADSAEYEEYTSVMNAMADEAEASTPDPEPSGWSPNSLNISQLRRRTQLFAVTRWKWMTYDFWGLPKSLEIRGL